MVWVCVYVCGCVWYVSVCGVGVGVCGVWCVCVRVCVCVCVWRVPLGFCSCRL